MSLTRSDFQVRPADPKVREWSIHRGAEWLAYADDHAHAAELITAFIVMYSDGQRDAKAVVRRALGI